jgi:hypothetical protein
MAACDSLGQMSDLTFKEKEKLEDALQMHGGYVLHFTNAPFAEFILEHSGRDIFSSRYDNASGSKANRFRMFWKKEDNQVVGKVLNEMMDYFDDTKPLTQDCRAIVQRLLGQISAFTPAQSSAHGHHFSQALAALKDEFFVLAAETDRKKAGLVLEKLLNNLFEIFELRPREPFRVTGEQIDGSFELDKEIYLLESKWERDPLPEADLLVFHAKVASKSSFTRGVFVAINGITSQAKDAITRGKALSFFVMDGHDLLMILSGVISLPDFRHRRVRLLAEQGKVCIPFNELK